MAKRDRAAEEAAARADRVYMEREEYEALALLRGSDFHTENIHLRRQVAELLVTNSEQVARLAKQNLALDHMRVSLDRAEAAAAKSKSREEDLTGLLISERKRTAAAKSALERIEAVLPSRDILELPHFKKE